MTAPAAPEALACSNRGQSDGREAGGRVHDQQAIQLHISTVQARVKRMQEALTRFEAQWRHVVHQTVELQQVAQLLRQEEYIDHAIIDAILAYRGVANAPTHQSPDELLNHNAYPSAGEQTGPKATNQGVVDLVGGRNHRRRNIRGAQLDVLRRWFDEHIADPYPSAEEKAMLALEAQMELRQVVQCAHMTPATLRFAALKYRMFVAGM